MSKKELNGTVIKDQNNKTIANSSQKANSSQRCWHAMTLKRCRGSGTNQAQTGQSFRFGSFNVRHSMYLPSR